MELPLRYSTLGTSWNHYLRQQWRTKNYDPIVQNIATLVMLLGFWGVFFGLGGLFYLSLSKNGMEISRHEVNIAAFIALSMLVAAGAGCFERPSSFGEEYGRDIPDSLKIDRKIYPLYAVENSWNVLRAQAEVVLYWQAGIVKELQRQVPAPTDDPFDQLYIDARNAADWAKEDFVEKIEYFFAKGLVDSTDYGKYFNPRPIK